MTAARVLIVDDEPMFLRTVSKMVSKYGYDVLQANDPRQALEIINGRGPFEVVLSDVLMPEMSGTDLVREVARFSPQTACILMTGGIVDLAEIPESLHVLHKPFPMAELIAAVVEAVARSTNLRAELRAFVEISAALEEAAQSLRKAQPPAAPVPLRTARPPAGLLSQ
jgi:DNA-binding NtrC family response regulator